MRTESALDLIRDYADDIASNTRDIRDARYKELACRAYWLGYADAEQMNSRADDIEYGSTEHIGGLSRFALEAEFRWLLSRCRELEAECVRLSEVQAEREKCRLIGCVCSECGALIGPSANMITEYHGDDLVISRSRDVNFCPNCGREVER